MFQKTIINKLGFSILSLLSLKFTNAGLPTPTPSAIKNSGQTPTVIKVPDLSFLDDPYYTCFNMKDSKACAGFSYYIPNSGYYGSLDNSKTEAECVSDFDLYVNSDINENSAYIIALCPEADIRHNTQHIAFRNSVYCGRLMYSQARWCRENSTHMRSNPQLSLCKSTCLEYANSIVDYSRNICKNSDDTVALEISKNIIEQWCNLFSDEEGCIKGTKTEVENCGYISSSIAKEARVFNPQNSCWKSQEKVEQIEKNAEKEESKEVKMGTLKWKILYPILVMVIVSAATFYFWRKQNTLYESGLIRIPDEPKEKILPSKAKPSRDYVDENYIRSVLEQPESTLPRKASIRVPLNREKSKKNVVYMVALYNYKPNKDDELELRTGDRICVEHQYNDGWGAGINESTHKFGIFPLICCSDNISGNFDDHNKRYSNPVRSRSRLNSRTRSPVNSYTGI